MRSIFFGTYVGIGALSVGALLASSSILDRTFDRLFVDRVQHDLADEAAAVSRSLDALDPARWDEALTTVTCEGFCAAEILVEAEAVERHPRLGPTLDGNVWISSADDDTWWHLERLAGGHRLLYLEQYEADPVPMDELFYWFDSYLPLAMIFLVMALGMLLLARRISRPIHALTVVAEAFGEGHLERSARTDIPAPLDTLARSLNTMSARLERTISEQQVLIGAVPHELRTPLSKIRFALDVACAARSEPQLRRRLERLDAYVLELESTVDDVVAITRLSRAEPLRRQPFELDAMLGELVDDGGDRSGLAIELDAPGLPAVSGHAALIRRAVSNVLENAMAHARTVVRVRARRVGRRVSVFVDDDGPGIPEDRRRHVFLPFARLDESRAREGGGAGLGLALVDLVMRKHEGVASVHPSALGGARVELTWVT